MCLPIYFFFVFVLCVQHIKRKRGKEMKIKKKLGKSSSNSKMVKFIFAKATSTCYIFITSPDSNETIIMNACIPTVSVRHLFHPCKIVICDKCMWKCSAFFRFVSIVRICSVFIFLSARHIHTIRKLIRIILLSVADLKLIMKMTNYDWSIFILYFFYLESFESITGHIDSMQMTRTINLNTNKINTEIVRKMPQRILSQRKLFFFAINHLTSDAIIS